MAKQRNLLHAMQKELDEHARITQENRTKTNRCDTNTINSRIIEPVENKRVETRRSLRDELSKYPSSDVTLREASVDSSHISNRIVFQSDRVSHST